MQISITTNKCTLQTGINKTPKMENSGTIQNNPEHGIIIINMRKYEKLNLKKLNETEINWISSEN